MTDEMNLSDCPVDGCPRQRRLGHLLCRDCWALVPADLQKRVNAAWGAVRRARGQDRLAAFRRHEEAADAAIHAVEAREALP